METGNTKKKRKVSFGRKEPDKKTRTDQSRPNRNADSEIPFSAENNQKEVTRKSAAKEKELSYEDISEDVKRFNLKDYRKTTIGSGHFSTVYMGIHKRNSSKCAIKAMDKNLDEQNPSREIEVHRRLQHPNIVQLLWISRFNGNICLIMPYMSKNVKDFLEKKTDNPLTQNKVKSFIRDVLDGVNYLHGISILHRDLKTDNLLLDAQHEKLKISDFGQARYVTTDHLQSCPLSAEFGVCVFLSPEALAKVEYDHGKPNDMWAVGLIAIEILSRQSLFIHSVQTTERQLINICHLFGNPSNTESDNDSEVMQKLKLACQDVGVQTTKQPFENAGKFKQEMINFYQQQNIKMTDVDESGYNLIYRCLMFDPSVRLTSSEGMSHPWF